MLAFEARITDSHAMVEHCSGTRACNIFLKSKILHACNLRVPPNSQSPSSYGQIACIRAEWVPSGVFPSLCALGRARVCCLSVCLPVHLSICPLLHTWLGHLAPPPVPTRVGPTVHATTHSDNYPKIDLFPGSPFPPFPLLSSLFNGYIHTAAYMG